MTRLKYERKARRLSQQRLSQDVHINQPDISQIERGILVPTEAQLARLAAHFAIAPSELLKEIIIVERSAEQSKRTTIIERSAERIA